MANSNVQVYDSRGDITFVLQSRYKYKESRKSSSFYSLYHRRGSDEKEPLVYMRTSSRYLMRASPVWTAMLKPNFPEGAALLFTGKVEVPLPEDDPIAFSILMHIVHGKPGVPRQVSLPLLTTLSLLVDKYQLSKVVARYSGLWIDGLKRDIPQVITPDLFHWLSISWVFRSPDEFNHVTQLLERESNGLDIDTYSEELNEYLPIPQIITGKFEASNSIHSADHATETISRKRQRAIFLAFDTINNWTDILQMPKTRCNSKGTPESHRLTCDAKLLDSLLVSADKIGIWPPPPAPFVGLTFKDVAASINQLDIVSFCSKTPYTRSTSKSHGIKSEIGSSIEKIRTKLSGLNLKDYSRWDWTS